MPASELRLLPGVDGADSPDLEALTEPLHATVWDAWLRIAADRTAGARTPLPVLGLAAGVPAPEWSLWWEREQLTHIAGVVWVRAGGPMLVARCGYSAAARDELTAWEIPPGTPPDPRRTYCAACNPRRGA